MGLPVIDADAMGRAFPELQMDVSFIEGHKATPAILTDEKVICWPLLCKYLILNTLVFVQQGLSLAVLDCESTKDLEDILRVNLVNFMG